MKWSRQLARCTCCSKETLRSGWPVLEVDTEKSLVHLADGVKPRLVVTMRTEVLFTTVLFFNRGGWVVGRVPIAPLVPTSFAVDKVYVPLLMFPMAAEFHLLALAYGIVAKSTKLILEAAVVSKTQYELKVHFTTEEPEHYSGQTTFEFPPAGPLLIEKFRSS